MTDSEQIYRMMLEAAEDRATINAIKNIVKSEMIHQYDKLAIVAAILGIEPVEAKN